METISWEDRDGARWIALEGELDHEGCALVRERFGSAVREGEGDVVVVLEGVTFLSSMGVGMLLRARETLEKQGRRLYQDPRRQVLRALERPQIALQRYHLVAVHQFDDAGGTDQALCAGLVPGGSQHAVDEMGGKLAPQ